MVVRSHVDTALAGLTTQVTRLEDQNAALRDVNAQMLAALKCALPVLRDGLLPDTVDYDAISTAVSKVQDALANAEEDH
jgi:hypothetical protein